MSSISTLKNLFQSGTETLKTLINSTSKVAVVASVAATAPFAPSSASIFGDDDEKLNVIIISNVGAYSEEDAEAYKLVLIKTLQAATKNHHRRSSERTRVEIVFTAEPTKSAFSGTPRQLYQAGNDIFEMADHKPRCNDIFLAYKHVMSRIDILKPDEVTITHIGPFFWAKLGCSTEDPIKLPQALPKKMPLAPLLSNEIVTSFTTHLVHPLQEKPVHDHIKFGSATKREAEGELELNVFTSSTTIEALGIREELKALRAAGDQTAQPSEEEDYDPYQ